jgi:nucleotide-binding universal stress UspA family protein
VKVLMGTDGSAAAIEAARRGSTLLPNANHLVVVAVAEPTLAFGPTLSALTATETDVMEELQRQARAEAHAAAARTAGALSAILRSVTQRVEFGHAGEVICRLAGELQADVVVVGSRGHGAFKRALLGSVSTFVVRNAPCAVLVVRDSDREEAA